MFGVVHSVVMFELGMEDCLYGHTMLRVRTTMLEVGGTLGAETVGFLLGLEKAREDQASGG